MYLTILSLFAFMLCSLDMSAQRVVFSHPHGFCESAFLLELTAEDVLPATEYNICYTLDGSMPTSASLHYTQPIKVEHNTIIRTAVLSHDGMGAVSTASYLFAEDVLHQTDSPKGYPDTWGEYCQIWGTAIADYGMDADMAHDATLAPKIKEGLLALPALSIVTDKDHFFSHERDSARGGIYIFTGTPVGDGIGRGWERPISMELFGCGHDLTIDCGVKLHGGHSRLPEKSPKHSLRLMFKKEYGPGKLDYPIFGPYGPDRFNQLVLRCMFGNAWQHWDNGNRKRAQYERDAWARCMQDRMGHPSSRVQYVHLFINGLYWGLYNLAERVDDDYCATNFGGKKSEYDVIKVEEDHSGHSIEPANGNMDKWNEMMALVDKAATSNADYFKLIGCDEEGKPSDEVSSLLDIDNFIDFMLINQYGGNTDWDHHNWFAFCNRETNDKGFRFICWDSELIMGDPMENNLGINNKGAPTSILNKLVKNPNFLHRYMDRACRHLVMHDGWLTPNKVLEVWDSIYHIIDLPLYDEAARWGDYRHSVHPYQSMGDRYTVDNHYAKERKRLLEQFFPTRSETLVEQLKDKGWFSTVDLPQMRINGMIDELADTLEWGETLAFTTANVYYTTDHADPVSWADNPNGTTTASAMLYEGVGNVLDRIDWDQHTLTIRAIRKGRGAKWSPVVQRTFVLHAPDDIREKQVAMSHVILGTYDLQGRRVSDDALLPKGVYIKNGKKYLVK